MFLRGIVSKEMICCRFNCATFRLPWVYSLRCPSKEYASKKGRHSFMDSEYIEMKDGAIEMKVASCRT